MSDIDVAERTMLEALAREGGAIFRLKRLVKRGPLCPFALMWVQTRHEPGNPENTMERSPHVAAWLSGEPVAVGDMARVYSTGKAGSGPLSRGEYARLCAEIAANHRANRYDPRAHPWKPVVVDQLTIPFAKDAAA